MNAVTDNTLQDDSTDVVITSEDEAQRTARVITAIKALAESQRLAYDLLGALSSIKRTLPEVDREDQNKLAEGSDFVSFSHLSKEVRNSMMENILTCAADLDDSIKATHRAVKAVKRVRLSEEVTDLLLLGKLL